MSLIGFASGSQPSRFAFDRRLDADLSSRFLAPSESESATSPASPAQGASVVWSGGPREMPSTTEPRKVPRTFPPMQAAASAAAHSAGESGGHSAIVPSPVADQLNAQALAMSTEVSASQVDIEGASSLGGESPRPRPPPVHPGSFPAVAGTSPPPSPPRDVIETLKVSMDVDDATDGRGTTSESVKVNVNKGRPLPLPPLTSGPDSSLRSPMHIDGSLDGRSTGGRPLEASAIDVSGHSSSAPSATPSSAAAVPPEFSAFLNVLSQAIDAVVKKAFEQGITDAKASAGTRISSETQTICDPLTIVRRGKTKKNARRRKAAKRNGDESGDDDEDVPELKGKQHRARGMRAENTNVYHVSRSSLPCRIGN